MSDMDVRRETLAALTQPMDEAEFRRRLDDLPDPLLRELRLPAEFIQRAPDAALLFEQTRFQRCGTFLPWVESPQALAWYREVMAAHPLEPALFSYTVAQIARHSSEAELDELIRAWYFTTLDRPMPDGLLDGMRDLDRLAAYLASPYERLQVQAARRLFELASTLRPGMEKHESGAYIREPGAWAALLAASAAHPRIFIRNTLDAEALPRGRDALERWDVLWRSTQDARDRQGLAVACLGALRPGLFHGELRAFTEARYAEAPDAVRAGAAALFCYDIEPAMAALKALDSPLRALLPVMAEAHVAWQNNAPSSIETMRPLGVAEALSRYPETYAALDDKARQRLLPLFDSEALAACGPTLAKVFAGSAKPLHTQAVALIARCTPEAIERSGLLTAPAKARNHVLTGMGRSCHPEMTTLIARHIHDEAHDEYSFSLALDSLERAGHSLEGLDPWAGMDLAALQAMADGQAIPAAVESLWNDGLQALLAPLGDALARWLLAILHAGEAVLPRKARQILAFLPAAQRSDLALFGLTQWIAGNGLNAFDWLVLPLPEHGDERAADTLAKAVKDWKKTRTQKSAVAMRLLCRLPGDYGAAQALDLWENGKLTESINEAAREGLADAAERRGMSPEAFLEQLVPDFGFGPNGLVLDVGPYAYTVRIRPDLGLTVIDPKGKAGKSLPKAKAGEDPEKRGLAESRFKALSKGLKPVLAQQAGRLARALRIGREWQAEAWQRLYAAHPLLGPLAQGVVWSALDADGAPLKRFRPTESGDLIDLADETWTLPPQARVRVTHPLELDERERDDWAAHFADYALTSPIGQWNLPLHAPAADELATETLARANGRLLNRARFGRLAEKWGYLRSAAGDGGIVYEHTWLMDRHWRVTLRHSGINVVFMPDEAVTVDGFVVERWIDGAFHRQRLGELPPAFLNTLLTQAEELKAVAEA